MGKRLMSRFAGRLAIATVGLVAVSSLIALRPSRADGPNSDASADTEDTDSEDTPTIDPMSTNATCYVCHIPFVREPISKVHFAAEVTCIKCHGLSADHANDEDIGATRPDITFKRNEIDAACRKCHGTIHGAGVKIDKINFFC